MKILMAVVMGGLLLAPSAVAAQTPAVDDPEATILSDLLVIAPTQGPAWWRVSKGDSVVWILGMPTGPTPKSLSWDQRALERRLTGARGVLLPPQGTVSIGGKREDRPSILRMLPGLRQVNGNVEKDMPPPLGERFSQVRTRLKRSVSRYATPLPLTASFKLHGDFTTWAGLERSMTWNQAVALAKRQRVPSIKPAKINVGTFSAASVDLSRPEAAACFDAMLDSSEVPVEQYRAAALGWAKGDLKVAISAPREPWGICENRLFQQGYTRHSIEAQTTAIETALKTPGKVVALSHLRTLLADEGILDRLAAKGYDIIYPTGLNDTE